MANSNGIHRIMYGFTSDTNGFLQFVWKLLSNLGMEVVKFYSKFYASNEVASNY